MCFPIYRSSPDQKYLTQRFQNSSCLMCTGLKINVHAWERERLRRRLKLRDNELKLIMTPIKSLAIVRQPLEKAFMCKSHFMIMTHSERCLLFFTCLLWDRTTHLFWGGGGGVSKRKTKSCSRKKREKIGTQGSMGKRLCKSHLFLGFV